jgi:hypothetical protein
MQVFLENYRGKRGTSWEAFIQVLAVHSCFQFFPLGVSEGEEKEK